MLPTEDARLKADGKKELPRSGRPKDPPAAQGQPSHDLVKGQPYNACGFDKGHRNFAELRNRTRHTMA
jgi:hypothetical protein